MPPAGYVVLTLEFRNEGDQWLGRCRELSTSTFGDTLEEVRSELEELVALHLNALEEAGERQRFFREHNIRSYLPDSGPEPVRRSVRVPRNVVDLTLKRVPLPAPRPHRGFTAV